MYTLLLLFWEAWNKMWILFLIPLWNILNTSQISCQQNGVHDLVSLVPRVLSYHTCSSDKPCAKNAAGILNNLCHIESTLHQVQAHGQALVCAFVFQDQKESMKQRFLIFTKTLNSRRIIILILLKTIAVMAVLLASRFRVKVEVFGALCRQT